MITCLTICSCETSTSVTGEVFADECTATRPKIGVSFVPCETTSGGSGGSLYIYIYIYR